MISLYADYHTHTVYSHGKGTILDNAVAASKKGLREIAITDHGPGHISFGIKRDDLKKMRCEVDRINSERLGVHVLLGVEANLVSMDGDIDISHEDAKYFDIILMGYHTAVIPDSFRNVRGLYIDNIGAKLSRKMYHKARANNTKALIEAINKHNIKIITHPGAKIPIDTPFLAREAAKVGTALEINSSHGFLTEEYVRAAMNEGVDFVINSDAHSPQFVGNFEKGIKTAEKAGLSADRIINAQKCKE